MPTYKLTEYSDAYSKTLESLWQYYRDEPLCDNGKIINFPTDNNRASFKFKLKIKGQTGIGGTEDVDIMVSLKYLSNFGKHLKCL